MGHHPLSTIGKFAENVPAVLDYKVDTYNSKLRIFTIYFTYNFPETTYNRNSHSSNSLSTTLEFTPITKTILAKPRKIPKTFTPLII